MELEKAFFVLRNGSADEERAYLDAVKTIERSCPPVVRCKDCRFLRFSDCYGECSVGRLGIVRPDDFCSRGERKADG